MEILTTLIVLVFVIQYIFIFNIWLHELAWGREAYTKKTFKKRWRAWIPIVGGYFIYKAIVI